MIKVRAVLSCALIALPWPGHALAQACSTLAGMHWLLGAWRAEGEQVFTDESWTQVSPSTFEGRGEATVKASGEKQGLETLRLVEMSGGIYYIAKVGHNALPIAFQAIHCSDDSAVFENPQHDFPKRLAYRRKGADGLVVEVSDGAAKGFALEFTRREN